MRESFKSYLAMTKLPDMQGCAVQGLYFSSWINSYSLALAVQSYLRKRGLLGKVIVVLYVDNVQLFAPRILQASVSAAIHDAVLFIGCTMKEDAGFCSWKNPLDPVKSIITRDNTEGQTLTWCNTNNNVFLNSSADLIRAFKHGRSSSYNPVIDSTDMWDFVPDNPSLIIKI